jgi:hypothetical protein
MTDDEEQALRRILATEMAAVNVDRTRSRQLARRIGARLKKCYDNAVTALFTVPELADATYCEGAVLSPVFLSSFEHAWIETADGTILDPTLALPDFIQRERWGIYFMGHRYTHKELLSHADHTGNLHLPIDRERIAAACFEGDAYVNTTRAAVKAGRRI